MYKTLGHRQLWIGMISMALVWGASEKIEASLWTKVRSAIAPRESNGKEISDYAIVYKEQNLNKIENVINPAWAVRLGQSLDSCVWIGTSYKDIPYSEEDFYKIRNEKIEEAVAKKRESYIAKKKAESAKAGAEVSELLNDLLVPTEQKKVKDDSKYLEGFDEDEERRTISTRMFVSQSRAVVIPAVYVQSTTGDLYCLELETGLTSWVNHLTIALTQSPFENEKNVFVVQGVEGKIIDKKSGFVADKIAFDRAVYPLVYAHDDRVYAASYDKRILCYKWGEKYPEWTLLMPGGVNQGIYGHDNGLLAPLSSGELLSYGFDGREQWSFVSKSNSDERIFLEGLRNEHNKAIEKEKADARKDGRAEDNNILFRITKEIESIDQKLKELTHRVRGRYIAGPVIQGQDLVLGSTDFQLYRMNRYSGLSQWAYTCSAEVKEAALIRAQWIWQLDSLGDLHRIDFVSGKGTVVAHRVDRVLDAKNNGVIFISKGKILIWNDEIQAELSGISAKTRVVASLESGFIVVCETTTGQILAYPTVSMRPIK